MSKVIFIAELIWLTAFFKVLEAYDPAKCLPLKNKKVDCSYHYDKSKYTQTPVEGVQLKAGDKYEQVESLDVSHHKFNNITFDPFSRLHILHMKNVSFVTGKQVPFDKWFLKLKLLEEIDMSGTQLGEELKIIWPKKLSRLALANMKLKSVIGLGALLSLEELNLSKNSLHTLPPLNESAPMKVINLDDNPITKLIVEQVAPYCELISFSIQIKKDSSVKGKEYVLTEPNRYSDCILIDEWFTKYFPGIHTGLMCSIPIKNHHTKNVTFDSNVLKLRNDCLAKSPATTVFELLLYAVFFSILFPILYFGNEAYNRYQSRKLAATPVTPVKHHRRRIRTTSPPETDVEVVQSEEVYDPEPEETEI